MVRLLSIKIRTIEGIRNMKNRMVLIVSVIHHRDHLQALGMVRMVVYKPLWPSIMLYIIGSINMIIICFEVASPLKML